MFFEMLAKILLGHITYKHGKDKPEIVKNQEIPVFMHSCISCVFQTNDFEELSNHIDGNHKPSYIEEEEEVDDATQYGPDVQETTAICGDCGINFDDQNACLMHMVIHNEPDTIKCPECESIFSTDLRFQSHKETMHVDTDKFKCNKCHFSSTNLLAISEHSQTVHMEIQVNIGGKEQTVIECDLCDYKCKYNIQLRKHLRAMHVMDQKYNCKECEYKTDYVANTWKHTLNQHPDKPLEFTRERK